MLVPKPHPGAWQIARRACAASSPAAEGPRRSPPRQSPRRRFPRRRATAPQASVGFDDGLTLSGAQLAGVLLRTATGMQHEGWHPDDMEYAAAESRSALMAWLWSLACPVVNRPRPELWNRGQTDALAWHRELQRAGLAFKPHTLRCGAVADVRRGLPPQALLSTATGTSVYDVGDDGAWERVADLAAVVPVTLAPRHGEAAVACVVGGAAQRDIGARLATLLTRPAAARIPAFEEALT